MACGTYMLFVPRTGKPLAGFSHVMDVRRSPRTAISGVGEHDLTLPIASLFDPSRFCEIEIPQRSSAVGPGIDGFIDEGHMKRTVWIHFWMIECHTSTCCYRHQYNHPEPRPKIIPIPVQMAMSNPRNQGSPWRPQVGQGAFIPPPPRRRFPVRGSPPAPVRVRRLIGHRPRHGRLPSPTDRCVRDAGCPAPRRYRKVS